MEKKLRKIFNSYKEKYKLATTLMFCNNINMTFSHNENKIRIWNHIREGDLNERGKIILAKNNLTPNQFLIKCLLHEIKHAIDWTYNPKKLLKEKALTNQYLYWNSVIYHNRQPYERRAIRFAKKEIKKWINK